jgi:Tol biopolymer transport system component
MMDADGRGRKQFQFPDDGYIGWDLNSSVSPDGKWLAYFTGSTDEPYDLAVNLFNLEDERTLPIANLLAPGYPENLMQTTLNKDLCPDDIPDCQAGAIPNDFENAITRTIAWSPDSKTLGFAAQIDGPSSDVYLFSLEERTIRRLVSDLENVWHITWSPNGNKVLYENFQSGNYMTRELYIADSNILTVQSPKAVTAGPFWGMEWIDDNLLLANRQCIADSSA